MINLLHGDCFDLLPNIGDGTVDMVCADVPYGTTECKWDSILDLKRMWPELYRVAKPNAAIVLFSAQPFTSVLVTSNIRHFKYNLIWKKSRPTGHMNAKKQPLREHEEICVFYAKQCTYNPQFGQGLPNHVSKSGRVRIKSESELHGKQYEMVESHTERKYPKSILPFKSVSTTDTQHPTQKPVDLIRYLIETYSNPGETVLDFTMGSGTAGVACIESGRKFIGIERDKEIFEVAKMRCGIKTPENQLQNA